MSFHQALEQNQASLTPAEKRIGSLLLADPRQAPFLTAAQVAERAGVHESTVVRFAQKIGYSGYLTLRNDLGADSLRREDPSIQMHDVGENFSLALVVATQIEVLSSLPTELPQERLDEVVDVLLAAANVYLVGHGLVAPLVEFMHRKLSIIGIPAIRVQESGSERRSQLALVRPEDAVLVFAFSEDYHDLSTVLQELGKNGTDIVLVTDQETLMSPALPSYVLAIPRRRVRHGVIVPLTVLCYALEYSIIYRAPERVKKARQRLERFAELDENGRIDTAKRSKRKRAAQ
jgi:DNA-binding MurR/RpiR family transcriptional regulator